MFLNCGIGEDSWESLGLQGDPTSPSWRRSVLCFHCKDWCWSWNSNTLITLYEELPHLKRPWCWERLKVGGEGDNWGWDGWMASLTQWTWVWASSWSWWWTGKPGVLHSMGSQKVGHNWATRLNWTAAAAAKSLQSCLTRLCAQRLKTTLISCSSGGQNSEMSLTGLKSRCGQAAFLSGGSRGESVFWPF